MSSRVINFPVVPKPMQKDFTENRFYKKIIAKKIKNSGVIIQARMTSSRLPGKSMMLLNGVPVIHHVIDRCFKISNVEKVILAAPVGEAHDGMVEYCSRMFHNLIVFRGEEHDVLDRYYTAATLNNLEYIMRVTGDCPCIDPNICEKVIRLLVDQNADYSSNVYPVPTFYKGLDCEAFTYECLEAAHELADSVHDKGHVTAWMQQQDEVVKGVIRNKVNQRKKMNLCVDAPGDIERIEKLELYAVT